MISRVEYDAAIAEKDGQINALRYRLDQLERLIFAAKSERTAPASAPEQMALWDGGDGVGAKEAGKVRVTYQRKKKSVHAGRNPLPDHLPVEEITIEPEENTEGMKRIGEEITETLDYTPGSLLIKRLIRPKYARPVEQQTEGLCEVVVAQLPARAIDKGIAEAGLLAHIFVAKYVDHQPFYRQIKGFARDYGWKAGSSTFSDWLAACCTLMEPLYQCLLRAVIDTDYVQTDESPIKVLDSEKKGKSHQGYMWVYRAPVSGLVLFEYRKGRGANGVLERLQDFTGYLQTDGYSAYKTYLRKHPEVTGVSCLAHIRRKFHVALDNDRRRAQVALAAINFIYHVEAHCRSRQRTPQQRLALRRRVSLPVYEALLDWVGFAHVGNLSKGALGKALHYAKNELPKLRACFSNGRIDLDNNLIENSIRPLALGRKNYLFAGSHRAAQRAALMYSFFASCHKLDVNPREWLTDVLERNANHPVNQLEKLLPHRWKREK
jgi:transposase